jgi:hypothetical protein
MAADITRQSQGLGLDAEVNAWMNDHATSDYGSDLEEYGSLKDVLDAAKQEPQPPANDSDWFDDYRDQYGDIKDEKQDPLGMVWTIIPIIMIVLAGLVLFLFLRGRSGGEESADQPYYQNQ